MSRNLDQHSGHLDEEPEAKRSAPDKAPQQDSEIGYGKPPAATRFRKGQSGNPLGRPRKPKARPIRLSDAPSDVFLEEEVYRPVTVRENGKTFQLPLMQALMRAMSMAELKGSRLSQQYLLELAAAAEERHFQSKLERYTRLAAIKHQGEERIAEHKRRHLPPPELLPHPDDIVLKPATGEAFINGPRNPEEARDCDHTIALRNHLLLRAAHAEQTGNGPQFRHGKDTCCMYLVYAYLLDQCLPRRLRWQDGAATLLMCNYKSLSRRERERRIAAEFSHLRETRPEPLYMTPEMEQQIKRSTDQLLKRSVRQIT